MSRTLNVSMSVELPDLPLEQVEFAAQEMCDAILEVERVTGMEFGPVCQVNSDLRIAVVGFTCESSLLMRIGQVLIDSEKPTEPEETT